MTLELVLFSVCRYQVWSTSLRKWISRRHLLPARIDAPCPPSPSPSFPAPSSWLWISFHAPLLSKPSIFRRPPPPPPLRLLKLTRDQYLQAETPAFKLAPPFFLKQKRKKNPANLLSTRVERAGCWRTGREAVASFQSRIRLLGEVPWYFFVTARNNVWEVRKVTFRRR